MSRWQLQLLVKSDKCIEWKSLIVKWGSISGRNIFHSTLVKYVCLNWILQLIRHARIHLSAKSLIIWDSTWKNFFRQTVPQTAQWNTTLQLEKKKKKTQSASSFLCSDVAWPQLSACNPACPKVVPVSAAFVTGLSTVVPQRLFLMLIYGLSILDREWGSMGGGGEGLGGVRETIDKTVVEQSRQLAD